MSLNRKIMATRGISLKPGREVRRWLREDLETANHGDAEFVKRYTERQRANFGRLFEFAGVSATIIVTMNAIFASIGQYQSFGWGAFVLMLTLAVYLAIRGLMLDDRLDWIDNVLTAPPSTPCTASVTVHRARRVSAWGIFRLR